MKDSTKILMSLQGLTNKEQLSHKLVEIAFSSFADISSGSEAQTIQAEVLSLLGQDPYLQGKLDRLAGILDEKSE